MSDCVVFGSKTFGAASLVSHDREIHIFVDFHICVECLIFMNAQEFKKWLKSRGCTFETKAGGSGHLRVKRGDKVTDLPMHGSRKELGTGLVNAIKKQLGLK